MLDNEFLLCKTLLVTDSNGGESGARPGDQVAQYGPGRAII